MRMSWVTAVCLCGFFVFDGLGHIAAGEYLGGVAAGLWILVLGLCAFISD